MTDPLYDLLLPHVSSSTKKEVESKSTTLSNDVTTKYLSRLLSLHLSDLTTTEPQSLQQASQSNLLSLQALSSRSHRTTTISSDQLSTLQTSLPSLSRSVVEVREAVPALDESAVTFASTYSRSRDSENASLVARKESQLLARQADKLQDILELPNLLSAAIASASSGASGSANYSQALDLFAHIKRLQIIYPDSALVKSVLVEAELAMKDMTTNLVNSLRSQNIRLAAAIRTIGWLRRVVPELSQNRTQPPPSTTSTKQQLTSISQPAPDITQSEGSLGLLFLTARLSTFLQMTEALAPLRDLADQETERRLSDTTSTPINTTPASAPSISRRPSATSNPSTNLLSGQQTERYLKRYIEIFCEQSFNTISMYRNIFPPQSSPEQTENSLVNLPPALQTFPFHLIEMLMETLRIYLPNVTDSAARESLLMQVLYAANSLGRLGADFSMMIALLDSETKPVATTTNTIQESELRIDEPKQETIVPEPEWARIIKKHRIQASKLDTLAVGQNKTSGLARVV